MNLKRTGSPPAGTTASIPRPANPWKISADDFPADAPPEEKLWFALNYAVLAPSTHNTQPWQFHLHSMTVDLLADRSRALPVLDPAGRELIISCGAALFNLRVALRYFGYGPTFSLLPELANPDCLARVQLGLKGETDSDSVLLFRAIQERRTNRHMFRPETLSASLLGELEAAALQEGAWLHVVAERELRAAVADLVAEGDRRQWADRHFRSELAAWVRPNDTRADDGLPVSTQDLGNLISLAGPLVIRTFDLGKGHAAKDREIALYSPILAVLGTNTDQPTAWISAGQALARILLRAQSDGVSSSFLNQPIQTPELRGVLAETIGVQGFPQSLLRFGYGDRVPPTPRRPVSKVLV